MRRLGTIIATVLLLFSAPAAADPALNLQLDVKEFTLKNGMLFLVVERPAVPQVSVRLAIRAGSALEERGRTGIAHLLEHMMFKGTKNFGSTDYRKDAELQQRIDAAYTVVKAEQARRTPDAALIREKLAEMGRLRQEAQALYVPQVFSSQLGKNGAVGVNAFTSQDQTQYIASVPADMLEQWFSIASEQLFEPAWREFYVERDVVQREWDFRYVNNPEGAAWLDLNANAYTAHPYRNPVIGWKSDMERYSTQDAVEFHRRYYAPANAVCVLAGDVTVAEARRLAETYFERYPAGQRAPEIVTAEPPQQGPRRSTRFLEGARTPVVRIGFHGAPMTNPDFFALDALSMVLSQGRSARLTQRIVNQGLAVEAWASNPDTRYGGLVVLGGSPNEPAALRGGKATEAEARAAYAASCEELERLLLAEVENLKVEPVAQEELDRLRKLNQREFIDRLRKNGSVASTLATLEVQVGWRYLNDYLRNMEAVTPEDIQRVARRYLTVENRTTAFVIPAGEPVRPPEPYTEERSITGSAAMARSRSKPADLSNHSVFPTPAGWKHPLSFERRPKRIDYPDAERFAVGDTPVFYLPDRELPLVDLTIHLKAGSVDLKDSEAGLTDLLDSTMVRGGTESRAPAELAVLLDDNAIRLSVDIGLEEASIRLSTLTPDWEKGLAVLQEVLTRPRFDAKILAVTKEQQMVALRRAGEDAGDVAMREAVIRHFKGHPYGRDPLAELATLPAIAAEDLLRFLRAFFVPSNMVVALSGDIGREEARASLARLLEALPAGRAPERQLAAPAPTSPGVALIHKPGQVQSKIVAVLPGIRRTDPEFWKLNLLMSVFGGSDSLMYTRLRDDLGIVYSAGFYPNTRWEAGLLVGVVGCKGDQAAEAVLETVRIMNRLQADVPELEQKRLDALNSFVFNVDTRADLVRAYGRYTLRREPLDTLERIQADYAAARRGELQGLADRFLRPNRLQITVVADKTLPVRKADGVTLTLGENLKAMAVALGLPFEEVELR